MTVDQKLFIEAMTKYWEGPLKNKASLELQDVWAQIATTFNNQMNRSSPQLWQVLQPPTGTGKSKGTEVYCSLLAALPTKHNIDHILRPSSVPPVHPGILIVRRLQIECNEMAEEINRLAECVTARAHHGENKLSAEEIVSTPVLIITHSTYIRALRNASAGRDRSTQLELLHRWHHTERSLIIIDEAPDFIETTQLNIEPLKQVLGYIPEVIAKRFPAEIGYLKEVIQWMQKLSSEGRQEQMISETNMLSKHPDFTSLRNAMKSCSLVRSSVNQCDGVTNRSLHNKIRDTLNSIEALSGQWCLYAQSGERETLNYARHILPEDHPGAVILDATASTNLLYHLFESRVSIVPTPMGARRYDQVTLHVSRGHKVGKTYLVSKAKSESAKLINGLQTLSSIPEKTFICCHKDVEQQLEKFKGYRLGHWGAVEGSNGWKDCDTAVIFGLPYRDSIWAVNTYMAVQGPQSTEWIASKGKRPFGRYTDILRELETGVISTQVIQAINRVRCRRVIDEYGNCPTTDIYILLPSGKRADKILEHIETSMPGIKTVQWTYSGSTRKARKLKHAASLVSYLNDNLLSMITVNEALDELSIPKSSFEKMVPKLKDDASQLSAELTSMGITFHSEGNGRGATRYFVKT